MQEELCLNPLSAGHFFKRYYIYAGQDLPEVLIPFLRGIFLNRGDMSKHGYTVVLIPFLRGIFLNQHLMNTEYLGLS